MPIYALSCKKCSTPREVLTSYETFKKTKYRCKECGGECEPVLTTCNFNLQGDGFYKPAADQK